MHSRTGAYSDSRKLSLTERIHPLKTGEGTVQIISIARPRSVSDDEPSYRQVFHFQKNSDRVVQHVPFFKSCNSMSQNMTNLAISNYTWLTETILTEEPHFVTKKRKNCFFVTFYKT